MNPKVDAFLKSAERWQEELKQLRTLLLDCELTEELKWGKPCYTYQGGSVVIIQPFKAYCALLFFKGALLADPAGILVKTGPNTEAGRQIRFTDVQEIVAKEAIVKAYVQAAIAVEKAGLKVPIKKASELKIPEEFQTKLKERPALKTAFNALTPGRQRSYIFYFSAPKQSKTREARIEKCVRQILKGEGLNER